MRREFVCVLTAVLALFAGVVIAAEQAKTAEKAPAVPAASADAARLEKFMRRYYSWSDDIQVKIGPFKPSSVAGLLETTVQLSRGEQKQDTTFLVSADGHYLIQGQPVAISGDPFAAIRAKIDLKDIPSVGSPLAPVTIVEYSDFQCSFCRSLSPVLREQVFKEFPDSVRLYYKDFPLPQIHPWAAPAAALGRCIYKSNAEVFWAYHDWAFANQSQLNPENFKDKATAFAKEKGLDAAKLGACMEEPVVKAEVNRAMTEGQSLGVTGTPTMFINGRRVVGNQPFAKLREVIQSELDYARGK